jgi:hypothetical protein
MQIKQAGLFEDSIIIVHGDHGSRFSIHYPSLNNLDAMAPDDYLDCFSTLFAVKRPNLPSGRDVASRAVDELFQETLNVGDGSWCCSVSYCQPSIRILFRQGDRGTVSHAVSVRSSMIRVSVQLESPSFTNSPSRHRALL